MGRRRSSQTRATRDVRYVSARNRNRRDYRRIFQRAFAAEPTPLAAEDPFPVDLFRKLTPNYLTTVELEAAPIGFSNWNEPGFYYGNALDFTDLVNFWNLRACDIDLFFYVPNNAARLRPFVEAYSALLHDRPKRSPSPSEVSVWQRDRDLSRDLSIFGAGLSVCTFDAGIFNGLNLNPPVMVSRTNPSSALLLKTRSARQ